MKFHYQQTDCTRCQSKGVIEHYSHVRMGQCFKCGGKGYHKTKAAEQAKVAIMEALNVPVDYLQVGDVFRHWVNAGLVGYKPVKHTITDIVVSTEVRRNRTYFIYHITVEDGQVLKFENRNDDNLSFETYPSKVNEDKLRELVSTLKGVAIQED